MFRTLLPVGFAIVFAASAHTQEESLSNSSVRTYTTEDFVRYAPRTALDMIRQIPGFSIADDNDGSRGFGQASGNILINGQRVSSKSNSARDILSRIPAENVERIEIVDGATLDIPGLSGQVANVITDASNGLSGTWEWEGRVRETVRPYLDKIELSASGKFDDFEWTLGLANEPRRGGTTGVERVYDASGNLIETRDEKFNFVGTRHVASGSLGWTPENGHIANLNARFVAWQPNVSEISIRIPQNGGPQINRQFRRSEDEWSAEVGADYEFGIGSGDLKFIGLYRHEHSPFRNRVFAPAIDLSQAIETIFNQTVDETENILRSEYSWSPVAGRDWQIALEGAFNRLESEADYFEAVDFAELGPDLITDPIALVEEARTEISVTHGRKISNAWTMQASVGAEYSKISQSGGGLADGSETSQTFARPKGFVSTSYTPQTGFTLTGRLERKVGQLNFFDFIASSNINEGTGRDANPDLSPQQSWLVELEAERDFGKWGAGSLKVYGEDIEDIVDRIRLPGGGDGIGNIDKATRYGIDFSGTINFDPIGIEGLQFQARGKFEQSSLSDPVTFATRRINEGHARNWFSELRYDIAHTDWVWGIFAEEELDGAVFFLDELSKRKETPPFVGLYIEHKDLFGMTGIITFGNLGGQGDRTERILFSQDRTGEIDRVEVRERQFGDILTLRLSGSF